jgi:hypothetical protein
MKSVDKLRELHFEHGFEALPADVAHGRAVQSVADGHVVCRDRLGDGARGGADGEEPRSFGGLP